MSKPTLIKHAGGRPSKYSEQLADDICLMIMAGKTLVAIAATSGFPSVATLCRWLDMYPSFESKCTRARLMQAELMDQMILDVAENTNDENFQASKVKISAYQWRASKLAPKRFGEKLQQELTGDLSLTLADTISKARKRLESGD